MATAAVGTAPAPLDANGPRLSALEVAHLQPVLEDCIDKLAIIGYLMPHGQGKLGQSGALLQKSAPKTSGIDSIIRGQDSLEEQFQRVMELRDSRTAELPENQDSFIDELRTLAKNLQGISGMSGSKVEELNDQTTKDNLVKLHSHREDMRQLFLALQSELQTSGEYPCLMKKVDSAVKQRESEEFLVENEAVSKDYLERLQKDEATLQLKADLELGAVNGKIAILKDQIQEKKARLAADEKYIAETVSETVTTAEDKQYVEEKRLRSELKKLAADIKRNSEDHEETMVLLGKLYEELSAKLIHWSNKYDEDTMELQERLDALQAQKESDLQKLQAMTETYKEYEKVVDEDREEKEKLARKHARELLEIASVTKIQAWWRGLLVRLKLGPFSTKKEEEGQG
eukprot:scpid54701/ scgid9709/ IQ domain-containing protein G